MTDDNDLINQQFLNNWKLEFEGVLRKTIAGAMGYTSDGHSILGSPTPETEAEWATAQHETLSKLHQSFISSCKRSGILERYLKKEKDWRDYDYVGEGLSEWHPYTKDVPLVVVTGARKFNIFLEAWVKKSRKERTKANRQIVRRRERIPVGIAFEVLRVIEFFNRDRRGLDLFRELTLPGKYFDLILHRIISDVKKTIIAVINSELEPKLLKKETTKNPKHIHRLNRSIWGSENEIQEVRNFDVKWGFSRNRGNASDTRWANHFKNHLLKIVLSDEKPKIIKKLKPFKAQQNKLLKKIKQQNQKTLHGHVKD